jgi:hypothetical protein
MKKTNSLITMLLVTGISASTVFADTTIVNVNKKIEDSFVNLKEIRRDIIQAKSATADAMVFNKEYVKSNTKIKRPNRPPSNPTNGKDKTPVSNKPERPVADKLKEKLNKFNPKNTPEKDKFGNNIDVETSPNKNTTKGTKINSNKFVSSESGIRINKKGVLEVANRGQRLSKNSRINVVWHKAGNAEINRLFFIGKNITELTPKQNALLKERLGAIINSPNVKKFLITIRVAENGGGIVIVGKGYGKPDWIKKRIANLNYGSHPAEQLPKDAFPINKRYGLRSYASGELQITYTNWKDYKKHFGFTNFAVRNQRLAGLDLARGSHGGRGFLGLMSGKMQTAFKYGTQPWESSKNSTLAIKGTKKVIKKIKTIDFNDLSKSTKVANQVANDKDV